VNKTGYFTHPDCRKHEMGPGHPECPERLDAIEDRFWSPAWAMPWTGARPIRASLGRHRTGPWPHARGGPARPERRAARRDRGGWPDARPGRPDTSINVHTWKAALRAAGAALAATDAVMAGELENAFCAVRPPGHHACRDKAMGFCFFNNVAMAAKYALERQPAARGGGGLRRAPRQRHRRHRGRATSAS
jgi:acetoin utilization deacetylase AcuC-like enzyme